MKSRARNAAGFVLIELVIAAVLTAAAGALLAGALISVNRSSALRGDRAFSTQWLASQLALLPETATLGAQTSGTLPPPDDAILWTFDTAAIEPPFGSLAVVHWRLAGGQTADVVTYRPIAEQ